MKPLDEQYIVQDYNFISFRVVAFGVGDWAKCLGIRPGGKLIEIDWFKC